VDADEVHHRATQAKELKDNPAFQAAILALRKEWFGTLMTTTHEQQSQFLVMKLQALEAIPAQLQVFINDWTMIKGKHNG
jgi:hypothetical protein